MDYEKLVHEKFERKAYFLEQNLENSRILFRASSKLIQGIMGNYPQKFRRLGKSLVCPSCSVLQQSMSSNMTMGEAGSQDSLPLHSQSHVLTEMNSGQMMEMTKLQHYFLKRQFQGIWSWTHFSRQAHSVSVAEYFAIIML